MLKGYEAIYEKDRLKWVCEKPLIKDGTPVVVVVETPGSSEVLKQEIWKTIEAARGAWGTSKTLDEIDREIDAMRLASWGGNGDQEHEQGL